jgi:hypothetical protein
MATLKQKAFCMLQFAKHESVVSVQRVFRRQFQSDVLSAKGSSIFKQRGVFVKGKVQDLRVYLKKVWNE